MAGTSGEGPVRIWNDICGRGDHPMDHTHIITASDLERYADTRESEGVIPELVFLLVRQSVPQISECRIPYGDAVNQPGWDGLVETEEGFLEFVPKGVSFWEIGTGSNPQKKATDDFRKRTKTAPISDRGPSAFVFVTPRAGGAGGWGESEQTEWRRRRRDRGWREIRIIDGIKLANWLREFPALGRWMAKRMGLASSSSGISTPAEHWETIQLGLPSRDPPLPAELFTTGRESACTALQKLFEGQSQRLLCYTESITDVDDFVSAYLASRDDDTARSFGNRCLFVSDEDGWRAVAQTRNSHVLVAGPRLGLDAERADLQTVATAKGHAVVIPICGAMSGETPEIMRLRSPSES